jgi:sensor histidine kinase YesM
MFAENNLVSRIVQHLFFWALSFFVFLQLFKTGSQPGKIDYIYSSLFHATLIPAVYINLRLLLKWFDKGLALYLSAVTLLIASGTWLNYSFFQYWSQKIFPDYFFISYFSFGQVSLFFIIYIIITSLLHFSKSWFTVNELQRRLLESQKQKAQIELKALKAQINPHFFFNTLNSIYSMALDKDDRLPVTVLQLSDLMRYFLYESKEDFIPLEKELVVLNNYIALQRIRSGKELEVEIRTEGEILKQQIAPLLLITFLENAFKHGAKGSTGPAYIRMLLQAEDQQLNFRLENNTGTIGEPGSNNYKGVGLENVKRQLELLYPGKHQLTVSEQAHSFVVRLQLTL